MKRPASASSMQIGLGIVLGMGIGAAMSRRNNRGEVMEAVSHRSLVNR
jgi:hypothetical protein